MAGPEIERLVQLLARLPGLGPRSARRAALFLLKRREALLGPLATALIDAADKVKTCAICGNYDSVDPCTICSDEKRDRTMICVVEDVSSLWAMERAACFVVAITCSVASCRRSTASVPMTSRSMV